MATIRLEENGPAYTLYRAGTFNIQGATNEEYLTEATDRFREVLSEVGVEVPAYEFSHVTSVFLKDLGREVSLEALTIHAGKDYYEELLPRIDDTGVSIEIPTEGLAIGEKQTWYKERL